MSEKNFDRARFYLDEVAALGEKYGRKVRLMAVTKFRTPEEIDPVLAAGVDLVGENRPQEFRDKLAYFEQKAVEKHLIGNLQKNKLKYVVGKADLIESINSLELAAQVSAAAEKLGIVQDVLLEINSGDEENKTGYDVSRMLEELPEIAKLTHLKVRGLMSMAPQACDLEVERVFDRAHKVFVDIIEKRIDNISMDFMSMGMSSDYRLAIKHGSNIVRIGRALFDDDFPMK
ncbi:MAG: YggS family pyridoxal phosphate-dependent enzyme [Oscillospiraceae bacterium]|nr:YggS family pyridoxal phosphate-dependent enzyme [Oscillospiraceae bacterium]